MATRRRRSHQTPAPRGASKQPAASTGETEIVDSQTPAALQRRPLDAAAVIALQRTHGNAHVQRLLLQRSADASDQADDEKPIQDTREASIPSTTGPTVARTPVVQRRVPGGGARAPVRQAPQLPRGRHGQLPGQRLPRNVQSRRDKARREAFERRERDRIDKARRRFEAEVRQSQAFLQRWGREGSEPKTAREKLFRIFVESLKEWHDFSTSWDLAHTSYEGLATEHQTREEEVMHLLGSGKFPHADQNAIRGWFKETADALTETHRRLEDLDRYFIEHVIAWNEKHASLLEGFALTFGSPTGVFAQAIKLQAHYFELNRIEIEMNNQLRVIEWKIAELMKRIKPIASPPPGPAGPPQTSLGEG